MATTSQTGRENPPLTMFSARARELATGRRATIPSGKVRIAYRRPGRGTMYQAWIEDFLDSRFSRKYVGRVALIFTSPPFPLNRKKRYGNFRGEDYLKWLEALAPRFKHLLRPNGSIVIELGNAWTPGKPVMDTLPLEALLRFKKGGNLYLCEQFVCYNRARLPAPIPWVNIERIRVKDAFTHVWWMSPRPKPKASNRRVLKPYSDSQKELIRTGKYNPGKRPSEYSIGVKSFRKDNRGAIRSNVLEFSNTSSRGDYQEYVRARGLSKHPTRMHPSVAEFFIKFLTVPGDLVLDPFAGSNTTGGVAEGLGRRWISVEPNRSYIRGSLGWFATRKHRPTKRDASANKRAA